jgi:hypothetical protein
MSMFDGPCRICTRIDPRHDAAMSCHCHIPSVGWNPKVVKEIVDTLDRIEAGTYKQVGDVKLKVKGWTIYD